MARTAQQGFFSADFLARLERLALVSRRPVRGRQLGERRSRRKGQSVEFCDYRAYGVGDDLRYVDWNAYGRLGRLHVKLFVDEEDLCLHLLVDASQSMDFGRPTKLEYAVRLAAALGFVGLVNHERVGVGVLRDRSVEGWTPARGRHQFPALARYLGEVRAGGPTSLDEALSGYALRCREPGLAVVLSDLLDPHGVEAGFRALLERRFEVQVLHLLDPEELDPTLAGDLRLQDSETGELRELTVDAEALRGYRDRLAAFLDRMESFCRSREIGYRRVRTDTPVEQFVLSELRGLLLA